jgi:hypothetical protein
MSMRVLSPVGTFPLRLTGARLKDGRPVLDMAMGVWRSEVTFEPGDLPLAGLGVILLAAAFTAGRASAPPRPS